MDWKTATLTELFFNRPFGLRPFCPLASLRFSQVAGCYLPSPRLAIEQNDSQFFIPPFFHSLLTHLRPNSKLTKGPVSDEIAGIRARVSPCTGKWEGREPVPGESRPMNLRKTSPVPGAVSTALFVPLLLVAFASRMEATPANKKIFEKHMGPLLNAKLDSCATCHVRADANGAETLEEFPHNAFGKRLRAVKQIWKKEGKRASMEDRLVFVAEEDADGDGYGNLDEILMGRKPGDARDFPNTQEKAHLAGLQKRFSQFLDRYPWRPFEPVKRPPVPQVKPEYGKRMGNEIDAFLAAQQEERGLKPMPEAPREVLLRRVHLDLTGLAPTPEEIRDFLEDQSPEAYAKVVDALLESPAYGERWGKHWMDIWRYADWGGYKAAVRFSQPHIWHWRDWIIESLNKDKGYDQMIMEMLAADEAEPDDEDALRATGYLVRNFHAGSRDVWLDNVVKHTSQAFLGLTMGCARCHDHKYDPIPQEAYYKMRAIFEPYYVRTDRVPGELDIKRAGIPRAFDRSLTSKTYLFDRGDERHPLKDKVMLPGVPEALGGTYQPEPVILPRLAYQPAKRDFVKKEMKQAAQSEVDKAKAALALVIKTTPDDQVKLKAAELQLAAAQSRQRALVALFQVESMEDQGKKGSEAWKKIAVETAAIQRKASLDEAQANLAVGQSEKEVAQGKMNQAKKRNDSKQMAIATKAMKVAVKKIQDAKKAVTDAEKMTKKPVTEKYKAREGLAYPSTSTGRRLAFAKWLSSKANPLTARVAMNHIWLRHFGQAIVPTVSDFGANGRPPTHPALLDWLAAEFMARGWKMKEMHRLIVCSAAYRMSSRSDEHDLAIDPDNIYLWRMPARRMEGEIVRDNLLWVSGRLDDRMGGPDIDNKLGQESRRRSVYLRHGREKLVEFVQIFDGPKVSECYKREESVQPHQALAMENSKLTNLAARSLSERLNSRKDQSNGAFVQEAFLTVLGKIPKAEEKKLCLEFLENGDLVRKRERLISVLLNHNDFVTIR